MAERCSTKCHKKAVFGKEKNENWDARVWDAICEGASPGKEAQRNRIASQPVDGDAQQAPTLAYAWIHEGEPSLSTPSLRCEPIEEDVTQL